MAHIPPGLRLPDLPGHPPIGFMGFSAQFIDYLKPCRGHNVYVLLSKNNAVVVVAKPGRQGENTQLFGPELRGPQGEPSGWHVVVQNKNYSVHPPHQPQPAKTFPVYRCRYSFQHCCRALVFDPMSCCVTCGQSLAIADTI